MGSAVQRSGGPGCRRAESLGGFDRFWSCGVCAVMRLCLAWVQRQDVSRGELASAPSSKVPGSALGRCMEESGFKNEERGRGLSKLSVHPPRIFEGLALGRIRSSLGPHWLRGCLPLLLTSSTYAYSIPASGHVPVKVPFHHPVPLSIGLKVLETLQEKSNSFVPCVSSTFEACLFAARNMTSSRHDQGSPHSCE